jgi:hypothetical protein
LRLPQLRGQANLLARERSLFCSAFVQRLFRQAGVDLAPGVDDKHTTPEDISRAPLPHVTYWLQRDDKLAAFGSRLRRQVQARVRRLQRRVAGR